MCCISDFQYNEQIHDKEVRVVDSDGSQLGIMSLREAQRIAEEKKLDLVKIAPTAKPPVCRIMDYSKFKFDQAKKEKEARKKQKTVDVKEIRLSPNIEKHDVEFKMKKAGEFLKKGDKVKVTIRFRGREIGHAQNSVKTLLEFAKALEEFGVVEKTPKMEGRNMIMFMTPKPVKQIQPQGQKSDRQPARHAEKQPVKQPEKVADKQPDNTQAKALVKPQS